MPPPLPEVARMQGKKKGTSLWGRRLFWAARSACEKLFGAVYTMCLRFDIISSSAFINKLLSAAIQARICIMEIANANVLFGFVKKSMPMTRRANASKNRETGVYAFLSIVVSPSFYWYSFRPYLRTNGVLHHKAPFGQFLTHSMHKMHSVPFSRFLELSVTSTFIGQTRLHFPQEMHFSLSHFTRSKEK